MQNRNDDFVVRTEYNLKMLEDLQSQSPKKVKRFRSAFTTDQVNYLETQFQKFPYIGNAQRKEVAAALDLPERAVKIWFQNRRMREKKETGKEFDDETFSRKPPEGDQLHNVSMPSANEQQSYSLPLVTNVNKVDSNKTMVTNNATSSLKTETLTANTAFKQYESNASTSASIRASNIEYPTPSSAKSYNPVFSNNYVRSAEFSIDLCKKYNNDIIKKLKNLPTTAAKEETIKKLKKLPTTAVKEEAIKNTVDQKPLTNSVEQMMPEDLSSRKNNVVFSANPAQVPNVAPNNTGYVSVVSPFYTQPYYPASGVIWKPVNIVPTVTAPGTSIPLPVPNRVENIPATQESVTKKCCPCDCHVKSLVPYNFQPQPSSSQYIITAVQLPNDTSPKF